MNSGLVPMSKQEKRADLFLVFPTTLDQKHFILIPSLNVPEMSPSGTF